MMRGKLDLKEKQLELWETKIQKILRQMTDFLNEKHGSEWCELKHTYEKSIKPSFSLAGRTKQLSSYGKHVKTIANKYKVFTKVYIN